MLDAELFLHPL